MSKKTLVIGASATPRRYAHKAVKRLLSYGHEVVAIGRKETQIESVNVVTEMVDIDDLHTVTMYINSENQEQYIDYILNLKPKRIIFNPGSHNQKLEDLAKQNGVEVLEDCTLVMLDSDEY